MLFRLKKWSWFIQSDMIYMYYCYVIVSQTCSKKERWRCEIEMLSGKIYFGENHGNLEESPKIGHQALIR